MEPDAGRNIRKVVVVIASNREGSLKDFLAAWAPVPWDETIVIEDGPIRSFSIGESHEKPLHHVSWAEIAADSDIGDPMTFSRRDSAIKAYGFWLATRLGADIVVALDDDCLPAGPAESFVAGHVAALSPRPQWVPSIDGVPTRGLPYFDLGQIPGAVANMGLWSGVADFDAPQTLALQRFGKLLHSFEPPAGNRLMHPGQYWPWCAMNIAFRREIAPLMYMPRMGEGSPYRRFDDIWSGVILQRCCRHLNLSLAVGEPHILHARASDPLVNMEKEAPGIRANEVFWRIVEAAPLGASDSTPLGCAEAVARHIAGAASREAASVKNPEFADYLAKEGARMLSWCAIFSNAGWR